VGGEVPRRARVSSQPTCAVTVAPRVRDLPAPLYDRAMTDAELPEREDLSGYVIHATDGDVGKVDQDDVSLGARYLLVTTGPWILGRTVLLPATVIDHIDHPPRPSI